MASSYDLGHPGALLCGAHELAVKKKAPAVTLPQVVLVLAAVLPLREFDTQLALDILAYHQQRKGIRLRRDNWVSVRYAEELNSGQSSVTLQRTDRHGSMGQKSAD